MEEKKKKMFTFFDCLCAQSIECFACFATVKSTRKKNRIHNLLSDTLLPPRDSFLNQIPSQASLYLELARGLEWKSFKMKQIVRLS